MTYIRPEKRCSRSIVFVENGKPRGSRDSPECAKKKKDLATVSVGRAAKRSRARKLDEFRYEKLPKTLSGKINIAV